MTDTEAISAVRATVERATIQRSRAGHRHATRVSVSMRDLDTLLAAARVYLHVVEPEPKPRRTPITNRARRA